MTLLGIALAHSVTLHTLCTCVLSRRTTAARVKSSSTPLGKMLTKPSHYIQEMFASTRSTQNAGCPLSNRALSTMKWPLRPSNSTMMKLTTQLRLPQAVLLAARVVLKEVSRCHPKLRISPPAQYLRLKVTGPSGWTPSDQRWLTTVPRPLFRIRLGYGCPSRMILVSTGSPCQWKMVAILHGCPWTDQNGFPLKMTRIPNGSPSNKGITCSGCPKLMDPYLNGWRRTVLKTWSSVPRWMVIIPSQLWIVTMQHSLFQTSTGLSLASPSQRPTLSARWYLIMVPSNPWTELDMSCHSTIKQTTQLVDLNILLLKIILPATHLLLPTTQQCLLLTTKLCLLLTTKPLAGRTTQSHKKCKNLISHSSVSLQNSISLHATWHCHLLKRETSGVPTTFLTGNKTFHLTRPRRSNQSRLPKRSLRVQRNKPMTITRVESRNTRKTTRTTTQ